MERYRDAAKWQQEAGYVRATRLRSRVEVSGTTSSAADGSALFPGDTYLQTLHALKLSLDAVGALGGAAMDVVRSRVYLAPGANWEHAARAHGEVFAECPPANTMLFVSALVGEGLLVEVELAAELSEEDR